jgi:SAM-dependent methyltransferase
LLENCIASLPVPGVLTIVQYAVSEETTTGTPGSGSDLLGDVYSRHNRSRGRGFIFGGSQRVDTMRKLLPQTMGRVLDIGCRDGALAQALGLPRSSVGLDIDHDALMVVRERRALLPCRADVWRPLPFADATFDQVVAGEVLEHVPFPSRLLAELARVLKSHGVLVGSVPNSFRLKNRVRFLFGLEYETDPTHLHQFSPEALARMLGGRFQRISIVPAVGRFAYLAPALLANDLIWRASGVGGENDAP